MRQHLPPLGPSLDFPSKRHRFSRRRIRIGAALLVAAVLLWAILQLHLRTDSSPVHYSVKPNMKLDAIGSELRAAPDRLPSWQRPKKRPEHVQSTQAADAAPAAVEELSLKLATHPRGRLLIYVNGQWENVCGKWFWNNNHGAKAACDHLEYPNGGRLHKMEGQTYPNGGVYVGACSPGERPGRCTLGDNRPVTTNSAGGCCNDNCQRNSVKCGDCGSETDAVIELECFTDTASLPQERVPVLNHNLGQDAMATRTTQRAAKPCSNTDGCPQLPPKLVANTVPRLSSQPGGSRHRLVYGIHTTNNEKYATKLQAQFYTWAAHIPRERLMVIGPQAAGQLMASSICTELEKLCKVLTYLRLALVHAERGEFDWLLGMNEDQYVNQTKVLAAMGSLDPNQVSVYANSPCSQHWRYSSQSKGNSLPRSPGFGDDIQICEHVQRHGGVCGGGGIIWSRAAVIHFWETEPDLSQFAKSIQVDPSLSCLLAAAGIPIKPRQYHNVNYDVNQPLKTTNAAMTHIIGGDGATVAAKMHAVMRAQSLEE